QQEQRRQQRYKHAGGRHVQRAFDDGSSSCTQRRTEVAKNRLGVLGRRRRGWPRTNMSVYAKQKFGSALGIEPGRERELNTGLDLARETVVGCLDLGNDQAEYGPLLEP